MAIRSTALDNPTNYHRGGLDAAPAYRNLLDSIGNGVQVLQAANTGIPLQKLVDTAKSIAANCAAAATGWHQVQHSFTGRAPGSPPQVRRLPPTSRPASSTVVFSRSPIRRAPL